MARRSHKDHHTNLIWKEKYITISVNEERKTMLSASQSTSDVLATSSYGDDGNVNIFKYQDGESNVTFRAPRVG